MQMEWGGMVKSQFVLTYLLVMDRSLVYGKTPTPIIKVYFSVVLTFNQLRRR